MDEEEKQRRNLLGQSLGAMRLRINRNSITALVWASWFFAIPQSVSSLPLPSLRPPCFRIPVDDFLLTSGNSSPFLAILAIDGDNHTLLTSSLDSAGSTSVLSDHEGGVLWRELMPSPAMGFLGVDSAQANAPQDVFFGGYHFKVVWVDAFPVSAQMVRVHPLRNPSLEMLIGVPVPESRLFITSIVEARIARCLENPSSPLPAAVLRVYLKLAQEAFVKSGFGIHFASISSQEQH